MMLLTLILRDWWTALSNAIGCTLSDNSTCWDGVNTSGYDDGQPSQERHDAR